MVIRCEVEGCEYLNKGRSLDVSWSQIGVSRFPDAPSHLASYCPIHESVGKQIATEAENERKKRQRKEKLYTRGLNAMRRLLG
jgi:hypothetical protein